MSHRTTYELVMALNSHSHMAPDPYSHMALDSHSHMAPHSYSYMALNSHSHTQPHLSPHLHYTQIHTHI